MKGLGVYGKISNDLDTTSFCIVKGLSIETDRDFTRALWYMLSKDNWNEYDHDEMKLTDFMGVPEEIKGSRLLTKEKHIFGSNEIAGGVYLGSNLIFKIHHNIYDILSHREIRTWVSVDICKKLPFESMLMYNTIRDIQSSGVKFFDIDTGEFNFYNKTDKDVFKKFNIPRIDFDMHSNLVGVSPDGQKMDINDISDHDLVISSLMFFLTGFKHIDKKSMYVIVLPRYFDYLKFPTSPCRTKNWLFFREILSVIQKECKTKNVAIVYDDEIEMKV